MMKFDPLSDGISSLELIRASGSDLEVVNAARVSYGSISNELTERDKKLINYLIKHRHTSPFEHTQLVYRVKAPMFVMRQWMRHRVGVSYNEISGRYTVLPLEFYIPNKWRIQDPINKQGSIEADIAANKECRDAYKKLIDEAIATYKQLLEAGVCRELARGVLPVCTYTELIFTCNLVSLFHFVDLRADSHAQWEIQQYAKGMLALARPYFETSISAWENLKGLNYGQEMAAFKVEMNETISK